MFTMDVPVAPAQATPIVLAQAATPAAGATPQPDYILNVCKETQEMGDPQSAWRGVNPVGMLATYLGNRDHRPINMAARAAIKLTLVTGTTHGKLNPHTTDDGRLYYMYDPTPGYIGDDRAVFQAEFEGKVYKIVVDIKVLIVIDNNSPQCDPPKLIKVTKPSSGDSGFGTGYNLSSVTVTFADLAGAAVGQTNTNGITLDTNPPATDGSSTPPPPTTANSSRPPTPTNGWRRRSVGLQAMDMLSVRPFFGKPERRLRVRSGHANPSHSTSVNTPSANTSAQRTALPAYTVRIAARYSCICAR